jgi:hypothetical protein
VPKNFARCFAKLQQCGETADANHMHLSRGIAAICRQRDASCKSVPGSVWILPMSRVIHLPQQNHRVGSANCFPS